MDTTLLYTVKQGDGYLTIARYIFSLSPRIYIQGLVKRYDLMKEVAKKIESDLQQGYQNFKLKPGQTLELHTSPGYYIPRLSLQEKNTTLKATAQVNATKAHSADDHYFVIHCTDVNFSDEQLESIKKKKKTGAGHAYIKKNGEIVKLWAYNDAKGWATKAEIEKKELRGKLVNIELVYGPGEEPTEDQYQALAEIYLESKLIFNKWLPIAAHREIDRGLKNGHKDPEGFKFKYFYDILKKKNVPIGTINKQSQERFNQSPWCEHAWSWPPALEGNKFKKVTAKIYKSKGCK